MRRFLTLLVTIVVFGASSALAQTKTVSGKVTSSDGNQPLPGVNVFVKSSPTVGTMTDVEGNFTLKNIPANAKIIAIRFVGYQTLELPVSSSFDNVVLQTESQKIDEVVVVGYGVQKKGTFTGAASVVKSASIKDQPITSVDKALQGNAPGIVTQSTSGQPGSGQKILIRGIGSITAGTDPLWIVDGVPVATGNYGQMTATGEITNSDNSNVLAGINPNDIESMTVLKDASATSIYGSRAANGVILVTTKKGKAGKTSYNLSVQTGVSSRATKKFKVLNGDQYIDYMTDVLAGAGYVTNRDEAVAMLKDPVDGFGYPVDKNGNLYNFDWMKAAYSDSAPTYSADFSASWGNEKTNFYISGSYMDQTGIIKDASGFKRYSFRSNVSNKPTDWLKFGVNSTLSYTNQKTPLTTSAYYSNPILASAILPPVDPGVINGEPVANLGTLSSNFLMNAKYNVQEARNYRAIANAFAEINFTKEILFRTSGGIDFMTINENQWDDMKVKGNTAADKGGRSSASNVENMILNWTNTLQYTKTILEKLNMNFMLGQECQTEDYRYITAAIEGFPSSDFKQMGSGTTPTEATGNREQSRLLSYFANANLNWEGKYYLSGTLRRDGCSRFSADNRYANFWSIGGSWKISSENFMKEIDWVNNLQLRSSYGTQGNSSIKKYASLGLYSASYNYNGQPGTAPTQLVNNDLTWESQQSFNVGLDFQLFKGKLGGTVEYYIRDTKDLLLSTPLSSTSGFTTTTRNVGSIRNKGIEIALNGTPVTIGDFNWTIDANFSRNINEVTKLNDGQDIIDGLKVIREGEDIQSFYTYSWAGVNTADGRPMWYDKNGEIIYTRSGANYVRSIRGSAAPKFTGGLTNTFSYKGIQLSAQFYFQYGNKIFDSQFGIFESFGGRNAMNQTDNALNRWKKPGDITDYAKPIYGQTTYYAGSDRYIFDGSYIRLRNLTLSYSLPKEWASKIKMDNVRIFAQGTNLLTITKYKGFDPEVGVEGEPWFGYPNVKTMSVGLDIKF
jgi:TonB-dependent starch-binding outer membrane protein SusC